jgi:hypothetical protein
VQELGGVGDYFALTELNRIAEDVKEAEPALGYAIIAHGGRDEGVIIFSCLSQK